MMREEDNSLQMLTCKSQFGKKVSLQMSLMAKETCNLMQRSVLITTMAISQLYQHLFLAH